MSDGYIGEWSSERIAAAVVEKDRQPRSLHYCDTGNSNVRCLYNARRTDARLHGSW